MAFIPGFEWRAIVYSNEHEPAVVRKAMGRGDGCCERNATERFDGVGVELSVSAMSVHCCL